MEMPAGKFKAHCLKLMDNVQKYQTEITITKHGKPVAKLIPVGNKKRTPIFGCLKGLSTIHGDIVAPIGESWDAEH
jgi:prevent-host-death family protein